MPLYENIYDSKHIWFDFLSLLNLEKKLIVTKLSDLSIFLKIKGIKLIIYYIFQS